MEYLGKLIRSGLGLCTFDFGGCGNAEGEYISMGYFEQQEVSQVIEYLKSLERVGPLCLWGK
jgi:alpha/beta superfamily hydrolase